MSVESSQASVLSAPPPRLTPDDAARVARDVFGVTGSAAPLRSERDLNFAIAAADGASWVLKVSNSAEDRHVVEMENGAMTHVARVDPSVPVPVLHPARSGEALAEIQDEGATHLVRLVSMLPGALLDVTDLDERRLRELGRMLARLGRALRGFFHPAAGRVLQWDVQHFAALRPLLERIDDPAAVALVERALDRWEATVVPQLAGLRAQVIHGDLSLDNALFAPDGSVSGIVDFGDVSHTPLLTDLGVALVSVAAGRDDPLEAAASFLDGYEAVTPLEPLERALLPQFVAARLATSLAIAAWRVGLYPENADYITADNERFLDLLALLDGLDPADAAAAMTRSSGPRDTAALLARRARVFGPAMQRLTYRRPLHMVRAEGVWMIDAEGRRHLDAYNNVPVCGHSHPRVVEAVARQSRLLSTNMRYLHGAAVELAERLLATTPPELDTCLFVNSGSEANELAWRIATTVSGRGGGVVTEHAYHGVAAATAALSPEEWGTQAPPAHVALIPPPDGYRGRHRREEPGWAEAYAAELDGAAAELRSRGHEPAAVLVDGMFMSEGVLAPPAGYHRELVRRTHGHGAFFVADEVQAGHGRTGEHLWSFAASGVVPDAVTLGKPMGNGFPVAAVLFRAELAEAMAERTTYFSTFGGNPVACAAALAVLDVIEEERLVENAARVGALLRRGLEELAATHEPIGDVRGRGLAVGVELVRDRETREPDAPLAERVVDELRERGVLVGRTGKAGSALKIRPPLVFEPAHAELLVARLDEALAAACA